MLQQSPSADGRIAIPTPYASGLVTAAVFEHTLKSAYTAGADVIEMGVLPANARLISATIIGAGFTAGTTATVKVMTGPAGEKDDTRALTGTALFAAQSVVNTEANAKKADCLALGLSETHRGIGLTLSANEAAAAGKKITLIAEYVY